MKVCTMHLCELKSSVSMNDALKLTSQISRSPKTYKSKKTNDPLGQTHSPDQ